MAVPDFQSFFKPLLEIAADGNEHSLKTAREAISKKMMIGTEDLKELLPSGNQTKFDNRVAWAKTYFVQAKVLESPKRGYFRITERGRELLKKGHEKIDVKILNQYPEFVDFHTSKAGKPAENYSGTESPAETPEEILQKAYQSI
ncbi:MAG TPA: winged helix-turn-helix domain-containing protein, partial [Syntrophales bacterium]|nr:winged helix-turn-helix domain-containing protein [Syntrophales bacterium]